VAAVALELSELMLTVVCRPSALLLLVISKKKNGPVTFWEQLHYLMLTLTFLISLHLSPLQSPLPRLNRFTELAALS
jgi:hypothetical protein